MPKVFFQVRVPFKVKKKGNVYVSSCDVLDVHTQGYSEREAKENLIEALRLFIITCYERGTLGEVLRDCGFQPIKTQMKPIKDDKFVTVPIPFSATGSCLSECRA